MKNGNIYILKAYTPISDVEIPGEEHYSVDNVNVKVSSEFIGVFDSVDIAEKTIKDLVTLRKQHAQWYSDWTDYCAFILTEHKINCGIDEYGNSRGAESVRSYLGNGELNCFSDYDDMCEKKFNGRDDVNRYVKAGDYAFYMRKDKLIPILIDQLSPTKEEWSEHFKPDVFGDISDDSGLAYEADYGHCHPFSPYIFPLSILPKYEVPEEIKKKIEIEKEKYIGSIG